MADTENTLTPAGGSEPTALQQLRAIWNELDLTKSTSRDPRITDSPVPVPREWFTRMAKAIGALASAPASAPLALALTTAEVDAFYEEWEFNGADPGRIEFHNLVREVERRLRRSARECLAAAPVADERATVRKLIAEFGHGHVVPRNDGSRARCTGTAACKTCQMEAAALSGGSPEPVSGSEE